MVSDPRVRMVSFTGGVEAGQSVAAKAGIKKIGMELGSNSPVIVWQDADIEWAAETCVSGAFWAAGQNCIGVQRILVHEDRYAALREQLVERTRSLRMGDPKDEQTFIGPMISEKEAARLHGWIESAVSAGATLLCGGGREGAMVEATLLEDVPSDADVVCQEAFGPVAVLSRFSDFDAALAQVNDSVFGLQAGIFTRDLYKAQKAWDTLDVGGVVIGDVPSWRVDNMPYGGVKESGLGREGVKFAIEDMTEVRLMVIRTPNA